MITQSNTLVCTHRTQRSRIPVFYGYITSSYLLMSPVFRSTTSNFVWDVYDSIYQAQTLLAYDLKRTLHMSRFHKYWQQSSLLSDKGWTLRGRGDVVITAV